MLVDVFHDSLKNIGPVLEECFENVGPKMIVNYLFVQLALINVALHFIDETNFLFCSLFSFF